MMTDYHLQRRSNICARTGKELQPGEQYYSVLYDRDNAWHREEICVEAWDGPPKDAFSFWVGRVPEKDQPIEVDDEVLLDCFRRLQAEENAEKMKFRYVLALLLMRRKKLKFEAVEKEQDAEYLILRSSQTKEQYRVYDPQLSEEETDDVQDEVLQLLGMGAPA